MLTVTNNETGSTNSQYSELRGALFGLLEMSARAYRNPRNHAEHFMPKLKSSGLSNQQPADHLTVDITLTKYGKTFTFDLKLPVYNKLSPGCIDKAKVENANREPIVYTPQYTKGQLPEFVTHPFTKIVMGVLSLVNISNLLFPNVMRYFLPRIIAGASVIIKGAGVFISVLYFMPMAMYYLGNKYFENKLEDFYADVENDISEGNNESAEYKLNNRPFIFEILLDGKYPGSRKWHWRHYYLLAQSKEIYNNDYYMPFQFADSPRQKLLTAIGLLNTMGRCMPIDIQQIYAENRDKDVRKKAIKEYRDSSIKCYGLYIAQIPTDDPLYHELGEKFRSELQDCIAALKEGQYKLACTNFNDLSIGGYALSAYPDVAIMYYQLNSVLAFYGSKPAWLKTEEYHMFERLDFALDNAWLVQELVDKYYPEKSSEYREYMEAYASVVLAIRNAREPEYEYEVTELAELVTPLAKVIRERERQQRDAKNITGLGQSDADVKYAPGGLTP